MYYVLKKHLVREIPEDGDSEEYVSVREIEPKKRKPKMSPFEQEAFARGLMEYASLPNSIEDESYISGQMELTKNKVVNN